MAHQHHFNDESPHSKEKRVQELHELRALNARFENVLKNVRADNLQLERECSEMNAREDIQTRIGEMVQSRMEGARAMLREAATFVNHHEGEKKNMKDSPSLALDKHKTAYMNAIEGLRVELRQWAEVVCDLKINIETSKANNSIMHDSIKAAEDITSALALNRDQEAKRAADLESTLQQLQSTLNDAIALSDIHRTKVAEYTDPEKTKQFSTKVVEFLAAKEIELGIKLNGVMENEKRAQQETYANNVKLISQNMADTNADGLLGKRDALTAELDTKDSANNKKQATLDHKTKDVEKLKNDLAGRENERDLITLDIEKQKQKFDHLQFDLHNARATENELAERIAKNEKEIKAARDMEDVKHKEKLVAEGKEAIAQIRRAIANTSVDIQKEIEEYKDILGKAENRFEPSHNKRTPEVFHFEPPPGFDLPAPEDAATTAETRRVYKKGTASATKKKSAPLTPATPVDNTPAETLQFTPTPKKRRRGDDTPVRITTLDPLYQRVVLENMTDEAIDISGWKLINVAYAFTHQIPFTTVLEPAGTFTFMPRPPETKPKRKATRSTAAKQSSKVPPPFTTYWEMGGRDVQWPMENARAVLKDNHGNLIHEFNLGKK